MRHYLVDLRYSWSGTTGDARQGGMSSVPIDIDDDHDAAGLMVAEQCKARFRRDYGEDGDLNITVDVVAEVLSPKVE